MLLIALVNRPTQSRDDKPEDRPTPVQRRQVWQRFLNWLREPIPFPGMTFNFEPRQTRYNQDRSTSIKSARTR